MAERFDLTRKFMERPRDISAVDSGLRDRVAFALNKPSRIGAASWGKASTFNYGEGGDFSVGPFPEHLAGLSPMQQLEIWTEIFRREKLVRINGTNGAYVDFAKIEEIAFRCESRGKYQPIILMRMKPTPDTY